MYDILLSEEVVSESRLAFVTAFWAGALELHGQK